MQTVTVLYGEMGSGKNHRGSRLAERTGAGFLDGDAVMPAAMAERVARFGIVPKEIIDEFVRSYLFTAILTSVAHYGDVVVAQALYSRANRDRLKRQLESVGLRAEFVLVRVSLWQNFRQLLSRPNRWRWVLYWLLSKPFFQP